jgi:3-methylfumaryl-CoA hydratase
MENRHLALQSEAPARRGFPGGMPPGGNTALLRDEDIEYLRVWIGKTRIDEDTISARQAGLMAATLGLPMSCAAEGEPLPPLWHWIYFLEALPPGELGPDGHPMRGGFMPPVPLPNRMWAGGRFVFLAPVTIGMRARLVSRIHGVDRKVGRSGDLVFVTVAYEVQSPEGEPLIHEERDIVYKSAGRSRPVIGAGRPAFSKTFTPTSTTLFRYSALTFNGHRIHYDLDYCRGAEAYSNLVIHGPLNATLLAGLAEEAGARRLREFSYRALAPALLGETLTLGATISGDRVTLAATLGNGVCSMQAEARLAP